MLTAIRESDKTKVIGHFIEKDPNEQFTCDYCNNFVIHHKSRSGIKIGHFKHKPGETHCPNNIGESELHLNTKLDIHSHISTWKDKLNILEIEKWICEKSIRPDIYLETKRNKIAIEIQTTNLGVSEIQYRIEKYERNGIYVLWVLPYEHERIWQYKFQYLGYSEDGNNFDWSLCDRVKLKEMELFLYWTYFKQLIFWDLTHEHSDSFICIGFENHRGADSEFQMDGEKHYHRGMISKTIKSTTSYRKDIDFDQFSVTTAKEFSPPFRDYSIPKRRLFYYKSR